MQNKWYLFKSLYPKFSKNIFNFPFFIFLVISDTPSPKILLISKKKIIGFAFLLIISLGGFTKGFFLLALNLENRISFKTEKNINKQLKRNEFVLNQNLTEIVHFSSFKTINTRNQFQQTDFAILVDSGTHSRKIYPVSNSFPSFVENKKNFNEISGSLDNNCFPIEIPEFLCPAMGRISSYFGIRTDPVYEGSAWHYGIDIAGPLLSPIFCSADGVVLYAGNKPRWGNVIIIDHYGNGFQTIYAHLDAFRVKKGDTINSGHKIGLLGNTGKSTGPHLHFEIRYLGKPVNPLPFLIPDEVVVD